MGPQIEAVITSGRISPTPAVKRHVIAGLIAGFSLLAIYAGILVLAQGAQHALEQTASMWYWLLALMAGFGIQVGLFSFIRQGLNERRKSLTAGVATSGGVSAGSMVACCVHHLGDILPFVGLSGIAAFLASYQVVFLTVGVLSSAVGIATMLEVIQRHRLCPVAGNWRRDLGKVKLATMALSGIILIGVVISRAVNV